jgi:leucyl-tRNA synthetase
LPSSFLPVCLYIGGTEHSIKHLLYIRAIFKSLSTLLSVPKEPVKIFYGNGMVHSPIYKDKENNNYVYADEVKMINETEGYDQEGRSIVVGPIEKMSKSKKNVIRIEKLLAQHSSSAIRLAVMSDYPLEKDFH